MPSKSRIASSSELLRGIASGLRTAATRPNIYGFKPHPKQRDFLGSQARGRLFIGGNRSGKTVGGGVEVVNRLRGEDPYKPVKHEPPVRLRGVAVDFDHGVSKIMIPEIARWLPPSSLKNGSWEDSYDKQLKTLTLANDSSIEFMSYEQDLEKFAGTSRHGTWFDEEPPEDIFNECLLRHMDVSGDYWVTMTPVEGMTWIYDRVYLAAATNPDIHVVTVDVEENPHINPGEIDVILAGMDSDEVKARRHGQFVQVGGLIYKMFGEQNVLEETFVPPREWLHFEMMDHGFSNPTCWLWGAVSPDGVIVIYDEHYRSGEIVSWHAAKVAEKREEHGIAPVYSVGDPSIRNTDPITGTSVLLEYMEFGIPIILGNNDVKAGILRVAQKLTGINGRPELFIMRAKCPNLIWEIQRLRWATWANRQMDKKKNKKEEPHKKNDHACDALKYGVASRPASDSGSYVPENNDPRGASIPASAYDAPVDTNLARSGAVSDYTLGEDW